MGLLTVSALLVVGTLLVLDSTLRMTSATTYSKAVASAAGRALAKVRAALSTVVPARCPQAGRCGIFVRQRIRLRHYLH